MLRALQQAVAASKTAHQERSNLTERAVFLGTETGEVQKEVLKHLGLYGREAAEHAKERLAKELCDLIWNACDLANMLGIELEPIMHEMLERNRQRTWDK